MVRRIENRADGKKKQIANHLKAVAGEKIIGMYIHYSQVFREGAKIYLLFEKSLS